MTRAELLEELAVERFGPIPRKPRTLDLTPAEVTEFEERHERAEQRKRRHELAETWSRHGNDTPAGGI